MKRININIKKQILLSFLLFTVTTNKCMKTDDQNKKSYITPSHPGIITIQYPEGCTNFEKHRIYHQVLEDLRHSKNKNNHLRAYPYDANYQINPNLYEMEFRNILNHNLTLLSENQHSAERLENYERLLLDSLKEQKQAFIDSQ